MIVALTTADYQLYPYSLLFLRSCFWHQLFNFCNHYNVKRQLLTRPQWFDFGEREKIWAEKRFGMLLLPFVTAGPKHLAADCPDFPKSSSDPHCGLRILIGRIFLSSRHPSLNTFCNHLCQKLTVMMIITFTEKADWKPVGRGQLDI